MSPKDTSSPHGIRERWKSWSIRTGNPFKVPKLTKTAWVYLPYEYDGSKQYNILYLSHGGWSHETTPMVTPDNPQQS